MYIDDYYHVTNLFTMLTGFMFVLDSFYNVQLIFGLYVCVPWLIYSTVQLKRVRECQFIFSSYVPIETCHAKTNAKRMRMRIPFLFRISVMLNANEKACW